MERHLKMSAFRLSLSELGSCTRATSSSCAASPCVWPVSLMLKAVLSWGKGQMPNRIWTHQFELFFGHGLCPHLNQISLRGLTQSHWEQGSVPEWVHTSPLPLLKRSLEGQDPRRRLPGSSLTMTERLIYDTKVHLSDKSVSLVA